MHLQCKNVLKTMQAGRLSDAARVFRDQRGMVVTSAGRSSLRRFDKAVVFLGYGQRADTPPK